MRMSCITWPYSLLIAWLTGKALPSMHGEQHSTPQINASNLTIMGAMMP